MALTTIVNKYGKIIVLEDDLITGNGFLKFMNTALDKFEKEESVMQIGGYFFPIEKLEKGSHPFFYQWQHRGDGQHGKELGINSIH